MYSSQAVETDRHAQRDVRVKTYGSHQTAASNHTLTPELHNYQISRKQTFF